MKQLRTAVGFVFAVAAAVLFFSSPAQAQLELCNRTSYILYAAVAEQDKESVTTQGWARVVPGECKTALDTPLTKAAYYAYARTSPAHSGAAHDWGGKVRLCVAQKNFKLRSPLGTVPCSAESSALPFAQIRTNGLSVWTTTFTESDDLSTADAARTAGLKRLLSDTGVKSIKIDGKPDKKTGDALSAFRKRVKIDPKAGMDAMFDALETEALKTATPAGYTICNDTDGDVWTVMAMKNGRDWTTRGWWKIAAGSCAKAITTPLAIEAIYLHAEKHANAKLVSGPEKFCLTNMQFEIQGRGNCTKRGLTETGFAITATKGLSGYTAHIGNQGLVAPIRPMLN
jgi:uncharacterized membrane protein